MQVWRLQTNTDGGNIADYCIEKNIAAMGWPLDPEKRDILQKEPTFEKYCELADDLYEGYSSVKRLVQETEVGDIIWMRSKGIYYYARVSEKKWEFDFSQEAVKLDATNRLTNIHWYPANKTGDESSVPGCLTTGFIKGSTFQRIKKSGIAEYSQMLYNMNEETKGEDRYNNPSISLNEKDFWNLLQPDDVEDLLCMWLYKEKGYVVIPSTNKKGTELYECVLVNPKAEDLEHIYIQVKKGEVTIDASKYDKLRGDVYFLTTEGNVVNANKDSYHIVSPNEIYEFAIDQNNSPIIPEGIAYWIKFLTKAENENMDKSIVKGIMFDTNLSYSDSNEFEMLSQDRVCAYGDASRYINSFKKGDYVLYYSKGRGVIAIGKIVSDDPAPLENEEGLYHKVEMVFPNDKDYSHIRDYYLSAREIKSILQRGFYFASTIKTPFLNKRQVDLLIDKLKEKYN